MPERARTSETSSLQLLLADAQRLMNDAARASWCPSEAVPRQITPRGQVTSPRGAGDRTLDEIAVELLAPMLAMWLEQNLPRLVSEQVRAQVGRATRREINTLDTSFAAIVVRLITRRW